jgi:hypothetical protein
VDIDVVKFGPFRPVEDQPVAFLCGDVVLRQIEGPVDGDVCRLNNGAAGNDRRRKKKIPTEDHGCREVLRRGSAERSARRNGVPRNGKLLEQFSIRCR